ncbi:MAG TPA: SDR family NAD(P)-dependent oxidoreductase [Ktedonobacteraceae bacterium]|nr:SDR family NAD(P)-dependent oxidoreductase [Ktedonobacteraceae bacterium]
MKDFRGKVAVVTGAASGIGRALAEKGIHEGMKVVLADIEEQALRQVAHELTVAGGDVLPVVTDVSKAGDVQALADTAFAKYGAVHLLFNNAGVGTGATIWESSLADWQWVLGVNLWGVIHGLHYFVPHLLEQKSEAHIVNTASRAGLISSERHGVYAASKHAVVSLSETLAIELANRRAEIGVSVLCPQEVDTRIEEAARNRPAELQNAVESEYAVESMQILKARIRQGKSPAQIADRTFAAIREKTFYIITHPESMIAIKARMDNLLEGRTPARL